MRALSVICCCVLLLSKVAARDITVLGSGLTGVSVSNIMSNFTVDLNNTTTGTGQYQSKIQHYNDINAVISFEINESLNIYYGNQTFQATSIINIECWDKDGNQMPTLNGVQLQVDFNPSAPSNNQKLRTDYKIKDVAKYTVTVIGFTCNNLFITSQNMFKIGGVVHSSFTFQLDCSTDKIINSSSSVFSSTNPNYLFQWNKINVDEVDIEWAYVDEESLLGARIEQKYLLGYSSAFEIFLKTNKELTYSRLTVEGGIDKVEIPKTYNKGFIVIRTRAVKNNPLDGRITCDWQYSNNTNAMYVYKITSDFVPNLNWSYQLSFAENAKWKENIEFYDGMYRERQHVSNIHTTFGQRVLVGETLYDVEGRKAASILPSPSTTNTALGFLNGFNKNLSGDPYSHLDFNYNQLNYCDLSPGELSTSSGSSRYFSTNNPEKNIHFNQFIPDAQKYPLSTIDYTSDQTNRVSRQGGVGPTHQVGKYDTKYYYGKPSSQDELDRLFGTDVGYLDHYTKKMTIDPNGQAIVTYLDMHERTIATALAGESSTNSSILNEPVTPLPIRYDIITNTMLYKDIKGNKITGISSFIVTSPQNAMFTIDLKNNFYQDICTGCQNSEFCADCYYDIEIYISDDCGKTNVIKLYENYTPSNVLSTSCASNNNSHLPDLGVFFTEFLEIGSYSVSVKITVAEDKVEEYVKAFTINKEQIRLKYLNELSMDFSCIKNCEECEEKFGVSNGSGLAEDLRLSALEACQANYCESSGCANKRRKMLNDLGLNGQYGFTLSNVWTPLYENDYAVSSTWNNNAKLKSFSQPALYSPSCWQSKTTQYSWPFSSPDPNPFIVLDLGADVDVRSVKTQGKTQQDAWVKEYNVFYATEAAPSTKVFVKKFQGNSDRTTVVDNKFSQPITARYIYIYPTKWEAYPSMRVGLELANNNYTPKIIDHTSIFSSINIKSTWITDQSKPYYQQIVNILGRDLDQVDPIQDLLNNWDEDLADILLPLHPEYCSLEFCENNSEYYKYEADLRGVNTYEEALQRGYIDNTGNNASLGLFMNDNFVIHNAPQARTNYLHSFNFFNNHMPFQKTIKEWAVLFSMSHSNKDSDPDLWDEIAQNPFGDATYCEAERDMQWMNLRNIYLSIREEIYQTLETAQCGNQDFIGCLEYAVREDQTLDDV